MRGLWIANRNTSTTVDTYRYEVTGSSLSKNSSTVKDIEDYILCFNENGTPAFFSTRQISLRFTSKGMTTEQRDSIITAFEKYMLAVGKSVQYCDVPAIVFTFDDGYADNYTIAKPVFDTRGKKFTQYLVTGLPAYLVGLGQFPANKISDAQITAFISEGYDIQCHTHNHPDLTGLTDEQILAEYDLVDAYFAERGWAAPRHTAYPGGSFNATVKTQTALKRDSARQITTQANFTETAGRYQINSYSINITKDDSTALGVVKTAIDLIPACFC